MGFTALGDFIGTTLLSAGTSVGVSTVGAAIGDAATVAGIGGTIAGAAGMLSRRPSIPPSPVVPQAQVDQSTAQAEQDAKRREAIAGGIASTVGTPGGQAGEVLNPVTMGGKTLLGM